MLKLILFVSILSIYSTNLNSQTQFGDTVYSFNAGSLTPTNDYTLMGVEFAQDHFWITGNNAPYYNHRLYKISSDGSTLVSYTSLGSGYHAFWDLAYDGEYLYAVDRDSIIQIDLSTGLPTGEGIYISFGYLLLQGLAYDPATDHFWVIPHKNAQLQIICEIDRNGTILNSYPNKNSDNTTSLAWDTVSPNGPFLWTFSSEQNGFNSRGVMRQFSPAIGRFTGVEIEMENRSEFVQDSPLGMAFTQELNSETVNMITLQAGAIGVTDGLDWVVVYNADLRGQVYTGPEITIDPESINVNMQYGDSLEIPVYIGNSGNTKLEWESYIENSDMPGIIGDTLFNFNLQSLQLTDTASFKGVAYAKDHYWFSATIYPQNKLIIKVDRQGNLVATYPQPSYFGDSWSAITTDGENLYGTERYGIGIWSIENAGSDGFIYTGSISADALAFDPDRKNFFVSNSSGAIRIFDINGNNLSLLVTQYEIEGLAWDNYSPDGPFIWAWVTENNQSGSLCKAYRLNPSTGASTGVSFEGQNYGTFINNPEDAIIYPDYESNKLVFAGLQTENVYPGKGAYLAGYDLGVVPPPAWIHLSYPAFGEVNPQERDTLTVKFHAMMDDTTVAAVIRISSNDLMQPLIEIPVTIQMSEKILTGVGENLITATDYSLSQNYPNPFNPSTVISFSVPENSFIELNVYDIAGRLVKKAVNDYYESGNYNITFNGSDLSSGIYFYTLRSGDFSITRKMLLIR